MVATASKPVAELLHFWHTHRLEVLIAAGVILLAVRLALHWRGSRSEGSKPTDRGLSTVVEKVGEVFAASSAASEKQALISSVPIRPRPGPKRVTGLRKPKTRSVHEPTPILKPIIFYYSLGGSTRSFATQLAALLSQPPGAPETAPIEVLDLTEIDYDDYFIAPPKSTDTGSSISYFYLLLIPSYDIDTELSNFLTHLEETHHDFRIDTAPLSGLVGYSTFGLGDQQEWPTEHDGFCAQAIEVDKWMAKLTGRKRAFPVGLADTRGSPGMQLEEWAAGILSVANDLARGTGLGEGVSGSGDAVESGDEDEDAVLDGTVSKDDREGDVEDIGGRSPIPVDFTTMSRTKPTKPTAPEAMVPVSSPTYISLTKQGYSIVGTHSGVKICRWTKSALRGRGSCYKYSFYGIASHRCMEATPSLSCSNKCVFCWRHGTNPVGTTWRWQVDEPELIFDGIKENHYKKIKMMKGVPGVRAERFSEAMQIRHCALSLVGEPIFYPHINKLLAMLHTEHISSFLVCNAQHPDELAALGPVTQL
ncbi:Fe-S oxidoreductase, partial [Oleoguttula sp. CCFEE 5521]